LLILISSLLKIELPGAYIFEIILLCALATMGLIPLVILLSQKVLSNKIKTKGLVKGKSRNPLTYQVRDTKIKEN
jgi:hypothetical protein